MIFIRLKPNSFRFGTHKNVIFPLRKHYNTFKLYDLSHSPRRYMFILF